MALIPMIQVLFDQTKRNTTMPVWEGIIHVKGFFRKLSKLLYYHFN